MRMDHNKGNAELHLYNLSEKDKLEIIPARSGQCLPHTGLCHLLMTQKMILVLKCYTLEMEMSQLAQSSPLSHKEKGIYPEYITKCSSAIICSIGQ